jgi:mannonate dehydratase
MQQTWRWFGPRDKVSLADVRQAGAEGIVTALHDLPVGAVWPVEQIEERQGMIRAAGLEWTVVESLDLSERIKLREPGFQQDIDNFITSLRNLAACGIRVIAYNLIPVFSWMRTDVNYPLPHGGSCTRFDASAFAAFDLFVLQRPGAEEELGEERCRAAYELYRKMPECEREKLIATILQGLPGGNCSYTLDELRRGIERYSGVDASGFRANAATFLKAVCPVAEELGIRLCVHPDDPPRPLLGLPRIVSTASDLAFLMDQWPGEANGITFCTGALGVRADNDLSAMVRRFVHRIWFAHLRSTQRETDGDSFFEAAHLEGDADLVDIVVVLVQEAHRRCTEGDMRALPFRPDHGQQLLNDPDRRAQAGYPAIGRLRGLAELRGVIRACEHLLHSSPPKDLGRLAM